MKLNLIQQLVLLSLLYYQVQCYLQHYETQMNRSKRESQHFMDELFARTSEHIEELRYYEQYDFIIVGSGPGGCALANRLTENSKWNVLLIEAGDVETPFQSVPIAAPYMVFSKYSWDYQSESQTDACQGREENKCAYPHGKALGGSSVIYFMMHTRGNRRDFDRWAEAGNTGWSYNEVLPYFLKSERASLRQYSDSPYHNKNGLWSVAFSPMKSPLVDIFIKGNKEMGLEEIDYNADRHLGVSYVQANTLNGRRQSAYKAFLEPILKRPNLHIMINTRVTKILIDPETKVTYGVEFMRKDRKYRTKAKKEVILSAGAFHSPQLLTLSGVGMKNDLKKINISMIKELPVGKNMHDHIAFSELTFVTNQTADLGVMTYLNTLLQFVNDGKGLMTLPSGVEALGFIKTKSNNSYGNNVPDVEMVFTPSSIHLDRGFGITYGGRMKQEIYDKVYRPLEGTKYHTFMIALMLFHPKSVGHVEISDSNPFSDPKIYPNFFKQQTEDVETLLQGIKYVMKLAKTKPFRSVGARLHSIPSPYCEHIHFGTDDYWRCVIKVMAFSIQHQVGTCKMGPLNDRSAVVSPELKVHGIDKLRVVDTSIIPEAPTAHTNAASVMIGEKAADLIKKQWKGS